MFFGASILSELLAHSDDKNKLSEALRVPDTLCQK